MHKVEDNDRTAGDTIAEVIHAAGPRAHPPAEHYEQVLAASRAAWQSKLRSRRQRRWYALAASIVAVASVIFISVERAPAPLSAEVVAVRGEITIRSPAAGLPEGVAAPGSEISSDDELRTGTQGQAVLRISGGGTLRLASDTVLGLLDGAFALRTGTLYFDSAGSSTSATTRIETAFGTVENIGTQFELRASADALRVRVRSGAVALLESPLTPDRRAVASEELVLLESGEIRTRPIAPDDDAWSWAEELAIAALVEGDSILDYLRWIAHEMGRQLRFDSSNTELSAQFVTWTGDAAGLTPRQVLSSIEATSDFSYQLTDDGAILVTRRASR